MKIVEAYTDGACRGNPGPGGYGTVLKYRDFRKEISGGFRHTTNNRMEVFAAIAAFEALKEPCYMTLYSDSKYLVQTMEKGWLENWRRNGWKNRHGESVLNIDLWKRLFVAKLRHKVKFVWIKGHAENPENERCDFLATSAAAERNLPEDAGYGDNDKNG